MFILIYLFMRKVYGLWFMALEIAEKKLVIIHGTQNENAVKSRYFQPCYAPHLDFKC